MAIIADRKETKTFTARLVIRKNTALVRSKCKKTGYSTVEDFFVGDYIKRATEHFNSIKTAPVEPVRMRAMSANDWADYSETLDGQL